jgi:hypothetical protein
VCHELIKSEIENFIDGGLLQLLVVDFDEFKEFIPQLYYNKSV